nr:beta hexosaminidase subunit alpha [Hymenolepis microstoma]
MLGYVPQILVENVADGRCYYLLPYHIDYDHNAPFCFTLHTAIRRLLESLSNQHLVRDLTTSFYGNITFLNIKLLTPCNELIGPVYPIENSKEDHWIDIHDGVINITATEVWGALHALTSITQLVRSTSLNEKYLPGAKIYDYPRWPFRSFLLDTSRHFIPLPYILQFLRAMSTVKMNVFHWHFIDDQSFPYESYTFPRLSQKGSYSPYRAIYTQQDVRIIIEYARSLGIRVMPEVDSPGHTTSWGYGYSAIMTQCSSSLAQPDAIGILNPIKNVTYNFVGSLLAEITNVFPDNALHLGGDEVNFTCWRMNSEIRDFMHKMGFGDNYKRLENYYFENLFNKINEVVSKKLKMYVWQEIFDDSVKTNSSVVIHVWKGGAWKAELDAITRTGKEVIFSACWYLNYIRGGEDWIDFYRCDPGTFTNRSEQLALLKGGGAAMWGEFVDHTNLMSRSWPRGAAVGERLWSPSSATDINGMRIRLFNFRCFLLSMGLGAEPVTGPGYCDLS